MYIFKNLGCKTLHVSAAYIMHANLSGLKKEKRRVCEWRKGSLCVRSTDLLTGFALPSQKSHFWDMLQVIAITVFSKSLNTNSQSFDITSEIIITCSESCHSLPN